MEKITIKTKSDNEIIQECWDEGLGIILKEIDSHLVIEDPRDEWLKNCHMRGAETNEKN